LNLCWWCSFTGTPRQDSGVAGAARKFDANERTELFRDRLARELLMERIEMDRFLES
jgi:hypothetical protein